MTSTNLATMTTAELLALGEKDSDSKAVAVAELRRRIDKRAKAGLKPRSQTVRALDRLIGSTTPKASVADLPHDERVARYVEMGQSKGLAFVENMRRNAKRPDSIKALDEALEFLKSPAPKAKAKPSGKAAANSVSDLLKQIEASGIDRVALITALSKAL